MKFEELESDFSGLPDNFLCQTVCEIYKITNKELSDKLGIEIEVLNSLQDNDERLPKSAKVALELMHIIDIMDNIIMDNIISILEKKDMNE